MQLQPKREPGRSDRKVAAYAAEIVRLRTEGYTFEAIREALADVGIELSTSALRREVRRHQQRIGDTSSVAPSTPRASTSPARGSPNTLNRMPLPAGTSGHEIAEAFFNAHPSNPLLRAKESP